MHKTFRYPKISHTPKCSPTKIFGTVRQKILNKKSWYPFFCIVYKKSVVELMFVENFRQLDFKQ